MTNNENTTTTTKEKYYIGDNNLINIYVHNCNVSI